MKNKSICLPMFPICIFLLPGGITKLRIFEPKYLKMVSLASTGGGFVIAPEIPNISVGNKPWGSWVKIINFGQGEDGVLEIDVKCITLVEILNDQRVSKVNDSNNVQYTDVMEISHWSENNSSSNSKRLYDSLNEVFDNNALLNEIYDGNKNDSSYWLVARWLELLPLPFEVKSQFILNASYKEAKTLISSIIFNTKTIKDRNLINDA